jgi:hypothetical protein
LPVLARETRALIQQALDDIHLESDMRDAGSAVRLEATTMALDELLTQLDASGFVAGEVQGALWDFKRDGILPYERESIPSGMRPPVEEGIIEELKGELIDEEIAVVVEKSDVGEEWQEMTTPVDDEIVSSPTDVEQSFSPEDERAELEQELARLDARWDRRSEPTLESVEDSSALDELEDALDGIDL